MDIGEDGDMKKYQITQEDLEEEHRLLAEQAMRKAESDAFYEAMEEEYWNEMVEKEKEWRESQ